MVIIIKLLVFHDERMIPGWLYHSFVLCQPDFSALLQNELLSAKNQAGCSRHKRIHFSDLRSDSKRSSRTRTAVMWAQLLVNKLYKDIHFYFFGLNKRNLDYKFFGPSSDGQARDYRIFNTFFQMGLFSACRYFFNVDEEVEILNIFSEERSLSMDDPFPIHAPYKINKRESNVLVKSPQVIQVAGDLSREKNYPEYVNILNFVDVIMGGFSQAIDCTGNAKGCIEVANSLFPLCQRLSEHPYNINSRYYKRCAMSFFPKYRQSKSETIQYGVKPPENLFYTKRTLRLYQRCFAEFQQLVDW